VYEPLRILSTKYAFVRSSDELTRAHDHIYE